MVRTMTPERRRQLKFQYAKAVRNASEQETQDAWFKYLAALYLEDDDPQIFMELRATPRANGAKLDLAYLAREITDRQLISGLKTTCAQRYAESLNRYGLATIDVQGARFQERVIRQLGPEVIKAFSRVDPAAPSAVCRAMAMTWYRLVQLVHAEYGLPTVQALRPKLHAESDSEKAVLERDDFETRMTAEKRDEIRARIE
jgi:hypothetical protein